MLDYDNSVRFYDRMFGWLGYRSFWTLNVGYTSTCYMARFPLPHGYIGIQPAAEGGRLDYAAHATGIHYIAIWARNRSEVDHFHAQFLRPEGVTVTDAPAEYPIYAPGWALTTTGAGPVGAPRGRSRDRGRGVPVRPPGGCSLRVARAARIRAQETGGPRSCRRYPVPWRWLIADAGEGAE